MALRPFALPLAFHMCVRHTQVRLVGGSGTLGRSRRSSKNSSGQTEWHVMKGARDVERGTCVRRQGEDAKQRWPVSPHYQPLGNQPSACAAAPTPSIAATAVETPHPTRVALDDLALCEPSSSSGASRRNHTERANRLPFRMGCTWCKFSNPLVKASRRPARGATRRSQSSSLNANHAPLNAPSKLLLEEATSGAGQATVAAAAAVERASRSVIATVLR